MQKKTPEMLEPVSMAWPDSSPKAAEPKAPASSKVVEPVDQLGSSTPSAQRSLVVPANQDIGHVQGVLRTIRPGGS